MVAVAARQEGGQNLHPAAATGKGLEQTGPAWNDELAAASSSTALESWKAAKSACGCR